MTGKIDGIYVELKANVDASGVIVAEQKIVNAAKKIRDEFNKTSNSLIHGTDKIVKANNNASKSMGGFGRSAGQAGIQLQQFVGQVQGGQSAMLALSQQGADLGIVMGAPLIGAVVGIGASLVGFLIPHLISASTNTEELVEKIKSLEEATKRTAAQNRVLANTNEAETAALSKRNQELFKLIKKEEELQDVRKSAGTGNDTGQFAVPRSAEANQLRYAKAIEESRLKLDAYRGELDTNNQSIIALSKNTAELNTQTSETAKALQQQIAITAAELEGGQDAARRLSLALKLGYENAALLPQTLKDSLTELEAMETKAKQNAETEREEAQKTAKLKSELRAQEAKEKTARGSNLEKMQAEILGEEELLKLKYARQFVLLEESLIKDGLAEDTYNNLKKAKAEQLNADLVAIEKRKTDAMNMLAESERQSKISAVSGTMSALASLMNTGSRKLFKIGKAAAMGNAIVDGYSAVSKTMASTPYPFNIPLAAAQAIASAAQVQGIAKQKFGGAGGGANTFSGGLPAVNTTQAAPQQTQSVDVRVTSAGGGIVDMFNFEVANGASPILGG